jgi:inosose dehydratase
MAQQYERFRFGAAPDSWSVLDYSSPSWGQSYEKMLDEMVAGGCMAPELGPYGYFPSDPEVLQGELQKRNTKLFCSGKDGGL